MKEPWTYTAPELQHQLADSGAETIVLLNLFLPRLRKAQAELPALKRVIVTTIDDPLPFPINMLVRHSQQLPQPTHPRANDSPHRLAARAPSVSSAMTLRKQRPVPLCSASITFARAWRDLPVR